MEEIIMNDPLWKERRRKLRRKATPAEKCLWKYLQKNKLGGQRFLRQYGVGAYILDFYCPQKKMAVELDGFHHAGGEQKENDEERTAVLNSLNIKVLRFWNDEVFDNINEVVKQIEEELEKR